MANSEHVERLARDVDEWNSWRAENPRVRPDLSGASLFSANLTLADLSKAKLVGANLVLANLKGADLRGADLSRANLVGARLIGTDLKDANLSGADIRTAEDLTQEQLNETRGDRTTSLPEGLKRPRHWK